MRALREAALLGDSHEVRQVSKFHGIIPHRHNSYARYSFDSITAPPDDGKERLEDT
jgi:hypothetical protein